MDFKTNLLTYLNTVVKYAYVNKREMVIDSLHNLMPYVQIDVSSDYDTFVFHFGSETITFSFNWELNDNYYWLKQIA